MKSRVSTQHQQLFLSDDNKVQDLNEEDVLKSNGTTSETNETKAISMSISNSRKSSVSLQRNHSPLDDNSSKSNHDDDGVGTLSRQSSGVSYSSSRRESSSGVSVQSSMKSNGNE